MYTEEITIGRRALLKKGELFIDGQQYGLRTVDELRNFILSTQAMVCGMLEELMPGAVPDMDAEGNTLTTKVEAWRKYAADSIAFKCASGLDGMEAGRRLIQWCALARLVAFQLESPIRHSPEFAVAAFVADNGGKALPVTPENWSEYAAWVVKRAQYDHAAMSCIEGVPDPGPNPLAQSVGIVVPFLAPYLGSTQSDDELVSGVIVNSGEDLIAQSKGIYLSVFGQLMRLKNDLGLVSLFAESGGTKSDAPMMTLSLKKEIGSRAFLIRAQRMRLDSGSCEYCFRFHQTDSR